MPIRSALTEYLEASGERFTLPPLGVTAMTRESHVVDVVDDLWHAGAGCAAVHYLAVRPIHLGLWVVNDILRVLGRHDLMIPEPALSSRSRTPSKADCRAVPLLSRA
jgi:hypothetical protein